MKQNWETREVIHYLRASLQGERVTLTSGLKLALADKQIWQVGLPYHSGQLYQLYWDVFRHEWHL